MSDGMPEIPKEIQDDIARWCCSEVDCHCSCAKERDALRRQLDEAQAKPQSDQGQNVCGHNLYWRTLYGSCMACRVDDAKAQLSQEREALKSPEMLETLAAIEHEQWSGWMKYLFSKCPDYTETGATIINPDYENRWVRQMNTPYEKLSEAEKESDRKEARKTLAAIAATKEEPKTGAGGLE